MAGTAVADSDVIWRIGDPDQGIDQFSTAWFTGPDVPGPVFRVGTSTERADWPIIHPGPLNAGTGWQPCAATIVFAAPADHPPAYELVLDVLAIKGPCPDLDVRVNGRSGTMILDPWRDDRTRVPMTTPIAAWSRVVLHIPSDMVTEGDNEIVLTTVAPFEPTADERRRPQPFFESWFHFGSGVTYGSVELRRAASAEPPAPSVRVKPLPLFQTGPDGCLVELVDVIVDAPRGYASGSVRLSVGSSVVEAELDRGWTQFGHTRARLAVPDVGERQAATIELDLDGDVTVFDIDFRPARKWNLHLLPHVHLDVGFTDYQGKVFELHSRNIDRVLGILAENPDYAMSIDGSLILESFRDSRSEATTDRVVAALRDGTMSCNAFYALFLTGIASLEECYRAAYLAHDLSTRHGLAFDYANLTDVPSYSQAVPSMLRALGLKRFMGITNHGRAGNEDSDALHLLSPFQWEGPDGARVTSFFADCYSQLRFLGADPPTVVGCADGFSRFLARYDRDDYLPHDLPIVGIHADNEDLANGEAELVARWNATYEYPKLRYSTITDYFDAVDEFADRLPVVRGDGGSYWEDGVGSQGAAMATYRRTQQDLPVAEAIAAMTALVDPSLRPARERLDEAWHSLVMGCEHTWTSWHAQNMHDADLTVDQLDWKCHQIAHAERLARDEKRRALSQLGERVTTAGPTLLVANTLAWQRSGAVELELTAGTEIVDAEGRVVPADVCDELAGGVRRVRIAVPDVPPFGYRTFAIRTGGEHGSRAERVPLPELVETPRYRVAVDPGRRRVVGIEHLASGRQLIDRQAAFGLGEVVYVAGGGDDDSGHHTSLYDWARTLPEAQLDVVPAAVDGATVERRHHSTVIRLIGTGPTLACVETEIELHDHHDRVDVSVRLVKQATSDKESIYVAFPFAVAEPVLHYDRQQGWVDPAVDHQPGACNEWFTIQHAVDLAGRDADGEHGITWTSADAPLFAVGDIVRGRWPRRFGPPSGTVLSWVMNNYWWTNYPARQHGDVRFRYAFEPTDGWAPERAARFGRDVRTPLAAGEVTWLDKFDVDPRGLPASGQSLLDVELPDHLVATIHAPTDGRGTIMRLQETSGRTGTARVRLPSGIEAAWKCSAAEADREPIAVDGTGVDNSVTVDVDSFEVVTIRLVAQRSGA